MSYNTKYSNFNYLIKLKLEYFVNIFSGFMQVASYLLMPYWFTLTMNILEKRQ